MAFVPETWVEYPFIHSFSGKLAFDIGGNEGHTVLSVHDRFDRVISLEPAVESFEKLAAVCEAFPHVTALNVAAGDVSGTVRLAVQGAPMLSGQLTNGNLRWGSVDEWREVSCVTVDDLTRTYGVPDFIKVDTEGGELGILNGAQMTLRDHHPGLYVEIHSDAAGDAILPMLTEIYGTAPKRIDTTDLGLDHVPEYYWLMVPKPAG